MLRRLISLTFALLVWLAPPVWAANLALVVGIDQYQNLPVLNRAVEDANAYARFFEETGYEVVALTDPGSAAFRLELARFYDRIQPGDNVAFVYSGHGWSDGSQNYLVPADTPSLNSSAEAASLTLPLRNGSSGILDELAARGAGLTLAIIDACRDNPFPQNATRALGLVGGLAAVEPPNGTFIVYSAGANQTALDRLGDQDPFANSVFTRFFIPNMREFGDLRRAIVVTRQQVQEAASIVNHTQRPAYYDELSGTACLTGNCEAPAPTSSRAFAESEWSLISNSTDTAILATFIERYTATAPDLVEQARSLQVRLSASAEPAPEQPAPAQPAPVQPAPVQPASAERGTVEASAPVITYDVAARAIADCDMLAAFAGNPDNPPGIAGRYGLVLQAAEAVAACSLAHELSPDLARMKFGLAAAYYERNELGDTATALELAKSLLESGYTQAAAIIGQAYIEGRGVPEDYEQSAHYFHIAATGGFTQAQAVDAFFALAGVGAASNPQRGLATLQAMVAAQEPVAESLMAYVYIDGMGVRADSREALRLAVLAGEHGYSEGYDIAADFFYDGAPGLPRDIKQALKYYELAAAIGSREANLSAGRIYYDGDGVPEDYERAFHHFTAATRINNPDAYSELAVMYESGDYVDEDLSQALSLYTISQELGSGIGSYNLGMMNAYGIGMPVNIPRAADFLIEALQRGEDLVIAEAEDGLPVELAISLQAAMQALGVYSGALDGDLGPRSLNAMWQICDCED